MRLHSQAKSCVAPENVNTSPHRTQKVFGLKCPHPFWGLRKRHRAQSRSPNPPPTQTSIGLPFSTSYVANAFYC